MNNNEAVKNSYYCSIHTVLRSYPEKLSAFEKLWKSGEFRKAYVFVKDTMMELEIVQSPENDKIDEEFFWLYMH